MTVRNLRLLRSIPRHVFGSNSVELENSELRSYSSSSVELQFDDHRTAFRSKSNWELLRALLILRACGSDLLVNNSLNILNVGVKCLGEKGLGLILHPTLYAQFVAGQETTELAKTAKRLRDDGLRLMVLPSLEEDVGEGEESQEKYDWNLKELLRIAQITHDQGAETPCLQTKVTALLSADSLKNISDAYSNNDGLKLKMVEQVCEALTAGQEVKIPDISKEDNRNLNIALKRFSVLGKEAKKLSLRVLIDAEWSYVNPGCSLIALGMMAAFNTSRVTVGNTIQCYFKGALDSLKRELAMASELKTAYGVKLVRGAYLERERQIKGDATCASYEDTGINYNRVLDTALENIITPDCKNFVIVASHNESSVHHGAVKMRELGIDPKAGNVVFAQIFGMGEPISMCLARAGYIVYKSVPMGALYQVLPYLARRAAENRSILMGARKERELLQRELLWRIKG